MGHNKRPSHNNDAGNPNQYECKIRNGKLLLFLQHRYQHQGSPRTAKQKENGEITTKIHSLTIQEHHGVGIMIWKPLIAITTNINPLSGRNILSNCKET